MEEKSDRQDTISSALEGAQARLEDVEASVVSLTEELDNSSQEMRVSTQIDRPAPRRPKIVTITGRWAPPHRKLTPSFQTRPPPRANTRHGTAREGEISGEKPQFNAS